MSPAPLIALDMFLMYTLLGPVVLFAVHVMVDWISRETGPAPDTDLARKDPAVWSFQEIDDFLNQA
jgi:hypothetical protein